MSALLTIEFINANTDYFFLCFAVTLLMAVVFYAIMKKLDAKLFTPKQKE